MKKIFFILLQLTPFFLLSQPISVEDYRKVNSVLNAINSFYVDSIQGEKIIESAIVSVLKELDPHSAYISKEDARRAQEPLEGSFEGIGIQFQIFEDTLLVVQTIAGGPSEKVGILPGDRIIFVDSVNIAGVKVQNSDILKRLRGAKGTEVNLRILRAGEKDLLLFKVIRDKIPLYTVDAAYMLTKDIGYVKINNFGSTTVAECEKAFKTLKKEGMKDLILDLQGNGGGYLNAAVELTNHFLTRGELIVYTQGLHQSRRDAIARGGGSFNQGRIVVLVDEFSASASEIVSGAIQDWDRGVILGRRTFGKGLVQSQLELGDGSLLRLTTARYYTPTGRSIQKPYKNGEKYEEDLLNRYKKGEFSSLDSIHFPDSLKYQTLRNQRTVYGGGGIMPDVFIPFDTTKYTPYHRSLVARGAMNKTTTQYVDKNRKKIGKRYRNFEEFNEKFHVDDSLLNSLIENGREEKVEYNADEFEKAKLRIKLQMKAIIARDIWDTEHFYKIMSKENESVQRGIGILQNDDEYERILQNIGTENN